MVRETNAEETFFIDSFIMANRRERLRFELGKTGETRRRAIDRFSHDARKLLIEKYIHPAEIVRGTVCVPGTPDLRIDGDVYVMSLDEDCDRTVMPFGRAIDKCMGLGPYILVNAKRGFAFVETESDCEEHEYLYLSR